ncbi:MAG: hypothetical protein AAF587_32450 [Bacteroidota bacterium]
MAHTQSLDLSALASRYNLLRLSTTDRQIIHTIRFAKRNEAHTKQFMERGVMLLNHELPPACWWQFVGDRKLLT